jgi:hypothetical protein
VLIIAHNRSLSDGADRTVWLSDGLAVEHARAGVPAGVAA